MIHISIIQLFYEHFVQKNNYCHIVIIHTKYTLSFDVYTIDCISEHGIRMMCISVGNVTVNVAKN